MKTFSQKDLSLQVLKQFRLIYGSAKHQFRHIEKKCGISGSQLWLLQEIAKSPGIGLSELAKRLSIHLSTCSILVAKLKDKKLVVKNRSEADERRVGLVATASGQELLLKSPGPAEGVLPVILQELSEAELKKLHASLEKLISNLHILDGQVPEKMVDLHAAESPLADI